MDQRLIDIFQDEIRKQSSFAMSSVEHINHFFSREVMPHPDYLWYYVQNFLISSANVSKLLWESNKKQNQSRKDLRKHLKVKESSVLYSKTLRNDFEHYDERIETWYAESKDGNYVDSGIGPTGFMPGFDSSDILRIYDTTIGAVTFKGKVYKLQPIVDELADLITTIENITNRK